MIAFSDQDRNVDLVKSIPENDTFPALRDILALEGGKLLVEVLRQMLSGTVRMLRSYIDGNLRACHARQFLPRSE